MTGILIIQIIALLVILGVIFLDRKRERSYKWRRFRVSIPTLIVTQIIWYMLALLIGTRLNFGSSDGDLGYFIGAICILSIISTLLFSRWYANNY